MYAVIKVVNGSYAVHAEGFTDPNNAIVNYHGLCQSLWNAPDVQTACAAIVDENLDLYHGYRELIAKAQPNA